MASQADLVSLVLSSALLLLFSYRLGNFPRGLDLLAVMQKSRQQDIDSKTLQQQDPINDLIVLALPFFARTIDAKCPDLDAMRQRSTDLSEYAL